MHRTHRPLMILATVALLCIPVATLRGDSGSRAVDLFGKFVSFNNGVLTVKVAKGKYAGQYKINVPDRIPVLVYTSPGHPTTSSSPGAFAGATADMPCEVNIDSRQKIIRICLGDTKPAKVPKTPK